MIEVKGVLKSCDKLAINSSLDFSTAFSSEIAIHVLSTKALIESTTSCNGPLNLNGIR